MFKKSKMPFNHFLPVIFLLPVLSNFEATAQKSAHYNAPFADSLKVVTLNREVNPRFLTGAVSFISGEELNSVPGSNRLNALAGRLPGVTIQQDDGLPGAESSTFLIRGYHSFRGSSAPLILINGRRDDVSMLDPYDISSITILKDAASTAQYGMNSTNGVVLITTKRGHEGGLKINYNLQTSVQQPTRLPKFLGAFDYATLYNEATLNDDPNATLKYDAVALQAYKSGSDPFRYPNVNWTNEFLKKQSYQVRNNLNITGGNKSARYFFSGSYLSDGGIFNVDKNANTYNTNTNIGVLTARANVEINVGKNLLIRTDIRAKRDKRNAPGAYSASYDESLFGTLYGTPANAHPIFNKNGSLAGTNDYINNPYGLLNNKGYSNFLTTSFSNLTELTYDLSELTKGLKLKGEVGFTSFTQFYLSRTKNFEVYQQIGTSENYTKIGLNSPITSSGAYAQNGRIFDHSLALTYERSFGDHNVFALIKYKRDQIDNSQSTQLTQNFQGPRAAVSYRFKDRYMLDVTAAYEGSEQYAKGSRYGFFPAASAGWIISEEAFLKDTGIDFLKLRGSYGRTGKPANTYFEYLGAFAQSGGSGGFFGTTPAASIGIFESKIANPLVTWEKSLQSNAGFDLTVLKKRLTLSADYFFEKTKDILITNAITSMYGASINTPDGIFKNQGWEARANWNDRVKGFSYFVDVNFSQTRNEIVYMAEQIREHPWMYQTGRPTETRMGYVFDRFYTENDNIAALPNQSVLGKQMPGDLKYKDLNGDNVIDENDITQIGDAKIPQINYGAQVGMAFGGFDLRVLLQGTGKSSTYNSGATYWEFRNRTGNASEHHLERWTPGSEQSASYPRLTLSNPNNFVANSFWVQENSFLRLKFVELGYTLPLQHTEKIWVKSARIFVNGHNVLLWDKVKQKDPEIQDSGLAYPILRTFSLGLNVRF